MASKHGLIDYDKPIDSNHPVALLPKLWRLIRDDMGICKSRFSVMVQDYVWSKNPKRDPGKNSSTIHNYINSYLYSRMTWVVFLRGFEIARMRSVTLSLHVKFVNPKLKACSSTRTVLFDEDPKQPKEPNTLVGIKNGKRALKEIYDEIQYACGVTPAMSDELFKDYLEQAHLPTDAATLSTMRSNINKELKRQEISWGVAIKLIAYLSGGVISIGLHATKKNSITHSCYMKVVINADALDDDES